jgi:acyl-CoA thioesterase-1
MRAFITILIAVSTALSCGGKQIPTSPDEPIPVIVAFGDSLTSGPGVNPSQTWPALIQRRIQDEGLKYRVVNAGMSGDTSSEAVLRVNQALVPDTRILIVALGINDGLRGVPVSTIEKNLVTIVESAQARDIDVLLCGMEAPPLRGFGYSLEFHRVFTRIADRYKLPLVPFFLLGVIGHSDLNLSDGVHPNAAGHKAIADAIWQYLEPML